MVGSPVTLGGLGVQGLDPRQRAKLPAEALTVPPAQRRLGLELPKPRAQQRALHLGQPEVVPQEVMLVEGTALGAPAVAQPEDLDVAPRSENKPETRAAVDSRGARAASLDDVRVGATASDAVEDASPQAPAAPGERAVAPSARHFIVRAGVYREPAAARQELSRLRGAAMQATLEHPGRVYMVIVQRCSTRDEARQWVQRALQAGVRCTIDEE